MTFNKNLNIEKKKSKNVNILNATTQKNIIADDLIRQDKTLENGNLLHNGQVKTGLTLADVEYLSDVIDIDTFKERNITFETLPSWRLAKEKQILRKGPQGMKGCTKAYARFKWRRKQQGRVDKAKALLDRHKQLIAQFDAYKGAATEDADNVKYRFADLIAKDELHKKTRSNENVPNEGENPIKMSREEKNALLKEKTDEALESTEVLEDVNKRLANDAISNLDLEMKKTLDELDTIIEGYVLDEDNSVNELKKDTEKAQADRKKKAKKTGKEDAGAEFAENMENVRNDLLDANVQAEDNPLLKDNAQRTLRTTVTDLDGNNITQLSEMSKFFKKVFEDSQKPYSKENIENDKLVSEEDLSARRYSEVISNAEKVLGFAEKLQIPVPQELYYLMDIKGAKANALAMGFKDKLNPEKNVKEASVFLMAAASRVYYEALNRFAGYIVHDTGINKYSFTDDREREARNYDIFNMRMMTQVRKTMDMTAAYAEEIRKNRVTIYDKTTDANTIQDKNLKENLAILKGAQKTGHDAQDQENKLNEKEQEEIYNQWKNLLKNGIRGVVEVDDKDMNEKPWVLSEFADRIFELMKNNPEVQGLKGDDLSRYLIAMNDHLHHNLLQLRDELPKSSVGAKFCYIPKLRDDFIKNVIDTKFATLLRADVFYRDLLRNNSIVDDLFRDPKYKAVKNRQRAIMNAVNDVLGLKFYTNVKHLESLWANETVQTLLMNTPVDAQEHEKKIRERLFDADQKKKEPKYKSIDDVPQALVRKQLANSMDYGTSDKAFKDAIEKIKAQVRNNINVIDRKISLMGLCDTAKDMLKKNVLKKMGGEYLLGYDIISQDIVEYTVDNMMAYDGDAASIQRTWDRKFARTGLPKRLSVKMERLVSSKINADGKRNAYYLRPQGYKVSSTTKSKWKETNNKVNKVINSLKKIYNNNIKNFLQEYSNSDELRNAVANDRKQYVDDKLKLTKAQWEKIETYFEDKWIVEFRDSFENGEYSSRNAKEKLNNIKPELNKIFDTQLTINFTAMTNMQEKGDSSALREFRDTLVTREEYLGGLNKNEVIQPPKTVVKDDLETHVFGDDLLKDILKNKADRDILTKALEEALRDENSALHAKCPYLDDVRSLENVGNLSLIDYSQFFADLRQLLTISRSATKEEIEEAKNKGRKVPTTVLLLEDWRRSGAAGGDVYGIKQLLIKDILAGKLTADNFSDTVKAYEKDVANEQAIEAMRFDAFLATDKTIDEAGMNFSYTEIKGKKVNQSERLRKLNYAEKFWWMVREYDIQNNANDEKAVNLDSRFSGILNGGLLATQKMKLSDRKAELIKLAKWLDNAEISQQENNGKMEWTMSDKTQKAAKKLKMISVEGGEFSQDECERFATLKRFLTSIQNADPSDEKLKFENIMVELLLLGHGKDYFEAGGAGEKVFLNSNDDQYFADIVKKNVEISIKRSFSNSTLKSYGVKPAERDKILARLAPIFANLEDSKDPEVIAKNRAKYGVKDQEELFEKLKMYSTEEKAEENLKKRKKSEELGSLYIKRRDAIDNYPGVGEKNQGRLKVIRKHIMSDRESWKKIMTCSDSEFDDYLKEIDKTYSTVLDVLHSKDFRAIMPILDQYVTKNWSVFKERSNWTYETWWKDVDTFCDGFMNVKKGSKSILDNLSAAEADLVKRGLFKSIKQATLLERVTYIIQADPSAFNLLYDKKNLTEAVLRLDKQYEENLKIFSATLEDIQISAFRGKAVSHDPEMDALYKEIADLFSKGEVIRKKKEAIDGNTMLQRVEDQAKKGKEITEEDKTYADYNLLMQIIKPAAFSLSPEQFKLTLEKKFREFKNWQEDTRNANIYGDRNVIETKDEIRLELEIRKNEGKALEREYHKELSDYMEKKQEMGSVGLVAYAKSSRFGTKDISKAKAFIDSELTESYQDSDEEFIKGLLVERAIAYGKTNPDTLKGLLAGEKQRLISLDSALRKAGYLDENEIKKAIVFAFAQNADRVELPLDGTHEKDVKTISDELEERRKLIGIKRPVSQIAQRDYDEFMDSMDIALYTMKIDQFREVCEKKKKQLELVDACVEKIQAKTKELKVQVGLYDYFKKDIYEALGGETQVDEFARSVEEQLDKLIGDGVKERNELSSDSIREITKNYIVDSSALMQSVSDKSLTAEEKLFSSEKFTRADMEKAIAESGRKDLIKMFNALTVEEQKVFALALTFPDIGLTENEQLASNVALRDKEKENQKELVAQEQLAAFIYDQDFAPSIDYNVVMRRLMKTDRKSGLRRISKTMFEKAYKYTQFCAYKKQEMKPKDFEKLSDGRLTASLASYYTGKSKEDEDVVKKTLDGKAYYGAATFKELFKKIGDNDLKNDKDIKKTLERFNKYDNVKMHMLIHVLQDRTAVDYTTAGTRWQAFLLNGVSFVNTDRREDIKNSFIRPDGMDNRFIAELNRSMNHELFDKAAETLFSYQLKDTVDLTNKTITQNDFAKDALERKTSIDWKLLERAMDLVEEIETENLRIQMCRQTVDHTMDPDMPNKKAAALAREIEEKFREDTEYNGEDLKAAMKKAEKDAKKANKEEEKKEDNKEEIKEEDKKEGGKPVSFVNHFDFFNDLLAREAKKDPEKAMPLLSAFAGLSDNEKMLLVHALKNRDILDVSTDNTFTTAIGFNENRYVNELGRDKLADYYISHLGIPGAKNILATTQYDLRAAMRSLVSTQVSDARDEKNKKNFSDMLIGKKIFNFTYIGADRKSGIDWNLFANALKFVKRTENERKLLVGESEAYRSAGDISKYGRFKYNYQFMRKNLYRSGYRATRFIGRRIRAELEKAIPGYGVGQRILMACVNPKTRNKMLSSGFVKPGESQGMINDGLGYAGYGGTAASSVSMALAMVESTAKAGWAMAGEGITQGTSALKGLINVGKNISNIVNIDKPMENEQELKKEAEQKRADATRYQSEAQQMVTEDNHLNKEWILGEVSSIAGKAANAQQIMKTMTDCIDVLTGSSFGVQAFTNCFVGGIRAAISETLHIARFITSVCMDKKLMDKYFSSDGPLGKEIEGLKSGNIKKIVQDQSFRDETGTRDIMKEAIIRDKDSKFLENMSNTEIFRKAYGFKDFSEQASYVGWNIVQTLLQSSSPFGTDPAQYMRSSLILAAIGCSDCIGKQDNDSAQRVYNKLMGDDVR